MVYPKIIKSFIDEFSHEKLTEDEEQVEAMKSSTALRMKKILIKTVNKGTGVKAITKGLEVGGKTGTAHMVEKGRYVNRYNTAFVGFANDKKSKFTIGVVVVEPEKSHFAAQTSVPIFKKAVDIMIEDGYLVPSL